jgi:hypothetical protein
MEHECASPVYSSNNRTFWKNELFVAPWWAQHVYCLGSLRLNAKSSWWKVFAWTPRQQGFLHTFYFSHHSVVRFSVFAKKNHDFDSAPCLVPATSTWSFTNVRRHPLITRGAPPSQNRFARSTAWKTRVERHLFY